MATVTLDLNTITLGEALEVERQSGQDFTDLLRRRTTRNVVVLFIHELRTSDKPRSWHELLSLRISDSPFSISRSDSTGLSAKSSGSRSETSPT